MTFLKPCPFCRGEAYLIEGDESARIQCVNVKFHYLALHGDNNVAEDLVLAWNSRSGEAGDAEIAALRAKVAAAETVIAVLRENFEATTQQIERSAKKFNDEFDAESAMEEMLDTGADNIVANVWMEIRDAAANARNMADDIDEAIGAWDDAGFKIVEAAKAEAE